MWMIGKKVMTMVENKNGTTVSPGERIQQLCDTHQLTRKELALHLGVAPSQISRILNGDTKSINSDLFNKISTGIPCIH